VNERHIARASVLREDRKASSRWILERIKTLETHGPLNSTYRNIQNRGSPRCSTGFRKRVERTRAVSIGTYWHRLSSRASAQGSFVEACPARCGLGHAHRAGRPSASSDLWVVGSLYCESTNAPPRDRVSTRNASPGCRGARSVLVLQIAEDSVAMGVGSRKRCGRSGDPDTERRMEQFRPLRGNSVRRSSSHRSE
jgi:hypothetical protein